jgi:hypothetical protein
MAEIKVPDSITFNISERLIIQFIDRIKALCIILPGISLDLVDYVISTQQDFLDHFFTKLVGGQYNTPSLRFAANKFIADLIYENLNYQIDKNYIIYKCEIVCDECNNSPMLIEESKCMLELYLWPTLTTFKFKLTLLGRPCRVASFDELLTRGISP